MNKNPTESGKAKTFFEDKKQDLTPAEIREKLANPFFLPSFEELQRCFKLLIYDHLEWEKWYNFAFSRESPIFEFWTKEYIHELSSYLAQRVKELGGTIKNPIIILEVGAGDGRLTYFLQEKMNEFVPNRFKIIATDSGEWEIKQVFPVEKISHKEALEKYKPQIVIFSWMPYEYDCTTDFRATETVEEYILIGETDGGCCGDPWLTWGQKWALNEKETLPPPYEQDGFERVNLIELSEFQLSRINILEGKNTTLTVSFRRKTRR